MTSQATFRAAAMLLTLSLLLRCGGRAEVTEQHQGGLAGQGNVGGRGALGGQGGETVGPAAHMTECEALCARAEVSACSGGENACAMTCAMVTGLSACQEAIGPWLACAKTSKVTCDASGIPVFSDCSMQLASTAVCIATVVPPEAVQVSCGDYCAQVEAAGCSVSTPLGDCAQTCGLAGMVTATCQPAFIEYLSCAAASEASCSTNGELNTEICASQQRTYLGCMMLEVGKSMLIGGAGGAAAY
jgi:hypothetical protein